MNSQRPDFSSVSSAELTCRLHSLVANERQSIVDVIWHLDELDRRRELGAYRNIFDYCNRKLRLSNGCSSYRNHAVKLFRRFPVVATYLADGRVSLKKVILLKDVFTEDNVVALLEEASRSTEDQVARRVATALPRPAVPDRIRSIPAPRTSPGEVKATTPPTPDLTGQTAASRPGFPAAATGSTQTRATRTVDPNPLDLPLFTSAPPKTRRPDVSRPLNERETEFAFTCDSEFLAQFAQAKSLLSHKFPRGTHAEIFGECLRIAIEVILKKKLGTRSSANGAASSSMSRTSPGEVTVRPPTFTSPGEVNLDPTSPGEVTLDPTVPADLFDRPSRHVPKEVARAVWQRDGGSCAVVMDDGVRCGSTYQVQIDHHGMPYALGGASTEPNLRLACAAHNRYFAEELFGRLGRQPDA